METEARQLLRNPQSLRLNTKTFGFSDFHPFYPSTKDLLWVSLKGPLRTCVLGPRQARSWRLSAKTVVPAFSKQTDSSGGHRDLDATVLDTRRALPVAKSRGEPSPLELLVYLCQRLAFCFRDK